MRLNPRDFWALSLPEWRALCGAQAPGPAMTRGDLDRLLSTYPDSRHGGN